MAAATVATDDVCNVLMIFPRFNAASFWNCAKTCEVAGARAPAAPLGLITVAALLPKSWNVRFVNRNTEDLVEADFTWADLAMTGGMLPQQPDALHVIEMCREHDIPCVVGGPDVTSTPHFYDRADFQVLGEAEHVMEDFIRAWREGARTGVFTAPMGKVDVTKSPTPRFDLLKFDDYLHVGVQFSRGCPFNCEFCDIIELYGRVPRTKTTEQVLAELQAIYDLGYRGHVDFVDDNLIGNKKMLRKFLPELAAWNRARNFPFEFSTEASINLADDPELMQAMSKANFFTLFVGIESPDTDTLVLTQKKQNTRRSLQESVHKIYRAGLYVHAGFIVGFDSEKGSIAQGMIDCIEDTAIPVAMVGLLYALPNTQLTRRLAREGRLHPDLEGAAAAAAGDQCTAGLNFDTSRPRRDVLADYAAVLRAVYEPAAYFGRVRRVARMMNCADRQVELAPGAIWGELRAAARLVFAMSTSDRRTAVEFWRTVADCLRHNKDAFPYMVMMVALYLHLGPFAARVVKQLEQQIAAIDMALPPPARRAPAPPEPVRMSA